MENTVLFLMILLLSLTEFMIVFLLKRKVKKLLEGVESSCVRDWNGERILKNARKQTQSVCSEAEAVAMKSPVRKFFADTPREKL